MFGIFKKKRNKTRDDHPDIGAGIARGLAEIRSLNRHELLRVQKGVDLAYKLMETRFPNAVAWTSSAWEEKSKLFDELGELEREWQPRDSAVARGVWLIVASLAAIPMKSGIGADIGKLLDELLVYKIEALGERAGVPHA
jgi:hypothetical protein